MAPKKGQGQSKGKGLAPKASKPLAPRDDGEKELDDPVNEAISEHIVQI